ncbi:MAG: hypothetical protein FRX49_01779 [Trebouxia sp. A1-2]|nr:MAG: hypothetical protein FRX49_01779 [Trebouxia sp. A1-2]
MHPGLQAVHGVQHMLSRESCLESSCSTASVGYSSAGKNISTGNVQPAATGYCDACRHKVGQPASHNHNAFPPEEGLGVGRGALLKGSAQLIHSRDQRDA